MNPTPEQARSRANAQLRSRYAAVSNWDRAVIEQAIDSIGADGRPWSMNDLRDVLPDTAHYAAGLVVHSHIHRAASPLIKVGTEPSTARSTKGKPINLYRLRAPLRAEATTASR